jgi:hypothetical protein
MPPLTVTDSVSFKFSGDELLQRVAEKLSDGSFALKVDVVRGDISVTVPPIEVSDVGIKNVADVAINPATREEQIVVEGKLDTISGQTDKLTFTGDRLQVELPAGGSGLTDAEIRATPLPVSGTFYPATQPVSGTFWQATQPVSGTFWQATQPVSASALPLPTGASTEATLAAIKAQTDQFVFAATRLKVDVPAGAAGLTDTELRATPVPVSGTFYQVTQPVSGTFWQTTQPVSGPVTDAQLRATALPVSGTFYQATQPVSAASLPLPTGAATEVTLALIKAKTDNIDVLLSTRTKPADTQAVSGTFWQATQPVSGTFWQATQPVSGPLTDVQLRATAVPVRQAPGDAWAEGDGRLDGGGDRIRPDGSPSLRDLLAGHPASIGHLLAGDPTSLRPAHGHPTASDGGPRLRDVLAGHTARVRRVAPAPHRGVDRDHACRPVGEASRDARAEGDDGVHGRRDRV